MLFSLVWDFLKQSSLNMLNSHVECKCQSELLVRLSRDVKGSNLTSHSGQKILCWHFEIYTLGIPEEFVASKSLGVRLNFSIQLFFGTYWCSITILPSWIIHVCVNVDDIGRSKVRPMMRSPQPSVDPPLVTPAQFEQQRHVAGRRPCHVPWIMELIDPNKNTLTKVQYQ